MLSDMADAKAPRRTPKPSPAKSGPAEPGVVPDGFYRDMVWNLRNGVVAITRDGRLAVMNEIAYRVLGLKPRASDIGRPFVDVLKDVPDVVRILAGAFEVSHLPNRAEMRLRKTGKVIGYTLSLVKDARGRAVGATLFFKDLTRVEQLEERERLRDRLAALGEMAAAIAHEVKNPLAGIEVMAGILKRTLPESQDAQTILADIIKEAKMANVIVQEVLAFVRPIRLELENVSVADVISDTISMAESHERRGGATVIVDVPESLRPIQGDPHQLRQIFTNLVTNAFEAMNGSGEVQITAVAVDGDEDAAGEHGTGPTVIITVGDSGPGIPADVMDRIFSPFFTTKPQGSGLGLAIVRKIVDAHDGRIDVSQRAGGGTVFRVTLPVRSPQQLFAS
jgi:two-component system nitrogen regulation sensor histidine kinase GlnL